MHIDICSPSDGAFRFDCGLSAAQQIEYSVDSRRDRIDSRDTVPMRQPGAGSGARVKLKMHLACARVREDV